MNNKVLNVLLLSLAAAPAYPASIAIINNDLPGIGMNDPSPPDPVAAGGNHGATLGEQRFVTLQTAVSHCRGANVAPTSICTGL